MDKKNKDSINIGKQIEASVNMEKVNYQGFTPNSCLEWTKKNKKDPNDYKNL